MCLEVEAVAAGIGRRHGVATAALRYAVVAGSHVPSPLGRVLRLPAVPVPAFADPPFSLLDRDDAARAMVEALLRGHDGPLNIVGPGATSPWQAVRFGGRIPVPVVGPGWGVACRAAEVFGAPMPHHVLELLQHGRTADGGRAIEELELGFVVPTQEVLADLYEWATVTPIADRAEEGRVNAAPERSTGTAPVALPNYGIDADRVLATDSLFAAARRRLDGRYAIDQFGGDPHLMDLVAPIPATLIREQVEGAEHLPRTGPALLVSNRGFGVVEPLVLGLAVRRAAGRRLRVVGAPEVPVLGPVARKLGAVGLPAGRRRRDAPRRAPDRRSARDDLDARHGRGTAVARRGHARVPGRARGRASGRSVQPRPASVARGRRSAAPPAAGHAARTISSRRRSSPRRCATRCARCSTIRLEGVGRTRDEVRGEHRRHSDRLRGVRVRRS